MGDNGIVKERAHLNINDEVFKKNFDSIFGNREKIVCDHCDLSSFQKVNEDFDCPHCNQPNIKKQ